jgi:hypothetical protein
MSYSNFFSRFLLLGAAFCFASIQLGFLWSRQSQQRFQLSTLTFYFHSLHVSAPTGHLQVRYTTIHKLGANIPHHFKIIKHSFRTRSIILLLSFLMPLVLQVICKLLKEITRKNYLDTCKQKSISYELKKCWCVEIAIVRDVSGDIIIMITAVVREWALTKSRRDAGNSLKGVWYFLWSFVPCPVYSAWKRKLCRQRMFHANTCQLIHVF